MKLKIKDIPNKNYQRILHATHETTKLDCIIAIHNTNLGPALGGVRSWSYSNFDEQLSDTIRLAEAMSLKNSICGINFGGGKATINLKGINKTPELYKSFAEVVEFLKGDYLTAGDVNTFKDDLIECSKITKYVYGINVETSAPTSIGIFNAMQTTCKFFNGNKNLIDIHVAISGVGKVGSKLAKLLFDAGAIITVASINSDLINKLKKGIKINETSPANLFKTNCDIISPCALGGAINVLNKEQLNCKAIVGGANNQLDKQETAEWLFQNNIMYAPDYLVNAGGVMAIASEINNTQKTLNQQLKKISERLNQVFDESNKTNQATEIVAKSIAWKRINEKK